MVTSSERYEARTRRLMAQRAALPNTWEHRAVRRDLLRDVNFSLDAYLIARECEGHEVEFSILDAP